MTYSARIKEDFKAWLRSIDPAHDCLNFALEMTLPPLITTIIWLVWNPPATIIFILNPGFIAITSHKYTRLGGKISAMCYTTAVICLCQYGICILFQEKILLLAWIFAVTFASFLVPGRRFESAVGLVQGTLAISLDSNALFGAYHNIEMAIALLAAVAVVTFLSLTTLEPRITRGIASYAYALRRCLLVRAGEIPEETFIDGHFSNLLRNVSLLSLKIEDLIHQHRHLFRYGRTFASHSSEVFFVLQDVARILFMLGRDYLDAKADFDRLLPTTRSLLLEYEKRFRGIADSLWNGMRPEPAATPSSVEKWKEQCDQMKLGSPEEYMKIAKAVFALEVLGNDIAKLEKMQAEKPL